MPTPLATIRELLGSEPLPCSAVDLAAFDANLSALISLAGARPTIRLATKSIRSVPLMARAVAMGGARVRGLMTYCAAETAFLARRGFDDLLLAYPTLAE